MSRYKIHNSDENYQPHGEPIATASTLVEATDAAERVNTYHGAIILDTQTAQIWSGEERVKQFLAYLEYASNAVDAQRRDVADGFMQQTTIMMLADERLNRAGSETREAYLATALRVASMRIGGAA